MEIKMNYNIVYAEKSFNNAVKYIEKYNKHLDVADNREWLSRYIKSTVRRAIADYKKTEEWTQWSSCGGVTLIMSVNSRTKKGFDVVDVDITVETNFDESDYVTIKVRDGIEK